MFNICVYIIVYLSKTPCCFCSEFQTTSMQVASLTGVRQSGQSCWIWNADATHRAWYVCPHSSVSQACMCFPCEKSQPLKLGFGFQSAEFLHLTINLKPLDQIQEFFASSHSMFPHSHDLWNLPSHGDIQATDSWKHLALFCSLRQTAQRSSLRSRLAEPKHWSWNHSQLDQDLRRKCEASHLCQKAENCSAPKANELLLVVSSCHPSGAHREPTLTSCQSGIMAGLLLAKWNAFKRHTPLEVAVDLAKKKMKNDGISIPNEKARNICWDLPAGAYCSRWQCPEVNRHYVSYIALTLRSYFYIS